MTEIPFTSWHKWPESPYFDLKSFYETFDGGQSFAWDRQADYIQGQFLKSIFRLKLENNRIIFSIPKTANLQKEKRFLEQYLAIDLDFEAMRDVLPWRSDRILKQAIDAYPYLRILRQPLSETLLGFLCSSTKQIPQIKQILRLSAESFGQTTAQHYKSLPNWDILAQLEEKQLRTLKLGYRAKYIKQSADFLKENPQCLKKLPNLTTLEAKQILLQLPGVGEKIADCVLLFGLGRMASFPIDTWIEKILIQFYQLEGYTKNQLQQFALAHFGDNAGYAQQFLFSAARSKDIKI